MKRFLIIKKHYVPDLEMVQDATLEEHAKIEDAVKSFQVLRDRHHMMGTMFVGHIWDNLTETKIEVR